MRIKAILFSIVLLTAAVHLFKINSLPICLNADEATFGYNSFSILKTGKDEYGMMLPLRLKSFGDYKLPLYSYLSIPFIGAFGLSELSTRILAILIGILFPLAAYFLTKELFEDERVALLSAFLSGVSPWIQTIARQAHEAPLAVFLLTITATLLLKFIKTNDRRYLFVFSIFEFVSLFAYHLSRPIAFGMVLYLVFILYKGSKQKLNTKVALILIAAVPLLLFTFTDILYNPTRLKNLAFYNDGGFKLEIKQKLLEKNLPLFYNPVTQALVTLPNEYIKYFSPEFLVEHGDVNNRFGYPGISLLTIVEYLFIFVGLYFLFKKKPKHLSFLVTLTLLAPLAASLTLFEYSATRSLFLVIPLLMIISYGVVSLFDVIPKKFQRVSMSLLVSVFLFFNFMSWDFYFFHYPQRAVAVRSWQCGYKELTRYVSDTYDTFDRFNITTRNGEPYIFMLFYSKYPPEKYQKQAKLSPPDEYGFGQVWEFDKYDFRLNMDKKTPRTSYVGFPEHFETRKDIDQAKIKKITVGTEEIFWIYENAE
ncbi:hypothetical protein A3D80_01090 [Candidatus Roizmanbacteria bacterium RIFCSPHIGHO2_02_FULL_40_13b]|uniref:Glycosyltransferase RgtA/B/C/D-like domain-containing protein n=1 Tax=Candidatus Roizmanbacteria bacterium RIFCSPHIGHO2_01_FULL_39_24 TaxID=1802032 RepID=A0A1F7GNV9_9BACT|nr:MAG: hypothetical protein A2799_02745 [Candidatus Roizmanbacteria bacterium RIFCSPHIGHO2_01_FULL_39_24]OGK26291.1 MAG: hypothetical protein A3D80_01090 [Candidatus Roizmanbacteria bacterium RIFCSPHIGHO2_02_FULL_40_13b]OGK49354.1 MAG: hypothetical protein A3A56_03720 [Candidatus Roizmanbacteria bacterium RIFCSPLOWO2_01_FULL_40_32]